METFLTVRHSRIVFRERKGPKGCSCLALVLNKAPALFGAF